MIFHETATNRKLQEQLDLDARLHGSAAANDTGERDIAPESSATIPIDRPLFGPAHPVGGSPLGVIRFEC